jgi:hypothetical protein
LLHPAAEDQASTNDLHNSKSYDLIWQHGLSVDTRLDATRLKANNPARVRHYTAGQLKPVKIDLKVEAFDVV